MQHIVKGTQYRPGVQGLRAVLMSQVLLYHAWFVGSPIGVDAFIMVSSYLMTASFVRRAEAGKTPFFFERWMTTFKRLLPPLAIVVVAVLCLSLVILPSNRWHGMVSQSYASLTYWQNWLLAGLSTDYYAENHALASPLQHLWSMSMQGQMFLLWPVLMALCVGAARKSGWSVRKTVFWAFSLLMVASLAWLLFWAPNDASVYFDTRARVWEFAFGSAIAAVAPSLQIRGRLAQVASIVAFTVLITFCVVSIGYYPSPWAFIPLAAVSVLLLSDPGKPTLVDRLLSVRPLVFLGDISYAVYLVHWPVFVFYLAGTGQERLSLPAGIALIGLSLLLAYPLTSLVDTPVRKWKWANQTTSRKALVAGLTLWLSLTAVFTISSGLEQETAAAERAAVDAQGQRNQAVAAGENGVLTGSPGAAALFHSGSFDFRTPPLPRGITLEHEWEFYETACDERATELFYEYPKSSCSRYGPPGGIPVIVAGGSHVEQNLMPVLRVLADEEELEVTAPLQAACHWALPNDSQTPECRGQNENLQKYIAESPPELAFILVTQTKPDSSAETMIPGVKELIEDLTSQGIEVFGFRDNLRSTEDLYECSSQRPADAPFGGCLLEQADYFAPTNPAAELEDIDGYHFIETMDLQCQDGMCPTIIGNVFVYLDTDHLTKTYAQTTAPIITARIQEAMSTR